MNSTTPADPLVAVDAARLDWARWPHFGAHEFVCRATARCRVAPALLDRLQSLRSALGVPLIVTSGYRDPAHPTERAKARPGPHAAGLAADIAADGRLAWRILQLAPELGFTGIGVAQRSGGPGRFIHLDLLRDLPRPNVWSY